MQNIRMYHGERNGRNDDFEDASVIAISDNTHLQQQKIVTIDGQVGVLSTPCAAKTNDYIENQAFIAFNTANTNVFCMYSLLFDCNTKTISPIDSKTCDEFGEYGVLIKHPYALYDLINSSLSNYTQITKATGAFVNYSEYSNRENVQQWDVYSKFKDWYRYQNEFRFAFENKNNELLEFDLGCNIYEKGIAIPINVRRLITDIQNREAFIFTGDTISISKKTKAQSDELVETIRLLP